MLNFNYCPAISEAVLPIRHRQEANDEQMPELELENIKRLETKNFPSIQEIQMRPKMYMNKYCYHSQRFPCGNAFITLDLIKIINPLNHQVKKIRKVMHRSVFPYFLKNYKISPKDLFFPTPDRE